MGSGRDLSRVVEQKVMGQQVQQIRYRPTFSVCGDTFGYFFGRGGFLLKHKTHTNSSTHHVHASECFHNLPQAVPFDVYADRILISCKCLWLRGMNRADWGLSNLFTDFR